jgi:polyferredoxin
MKKIRIRQKKLAVKRKSKQSFLKKLLGHLYNKYVVMVYVFLLNIASWILWAFHFYFYAPQGLRPDPGERTLIFSVPNLLRVIQYFALGAVGSNLE